MSHRLAILLGFMLLAGNPAAAEPQAPVDVLIERLDSAAFKDRAAARQALVERLQDPSAPGLTDLLAARDSKSPEIRDQAKLALREIFEIQVLGSGRRDSGAEWIYWIDSKKGKTQVWPAIRKLKPESDLAKCGLQAGDVLASSGGRNFDKRGSVSEVKALLETAPAGKPLAITVLRGSPDKPFKDRVKTLELTVIPTNTERSGGRAEKPGEFAAWLKSLGKTSVEPAEADR